MPALPTPAARRPRGRPPGKGRGRGRGRGGTLSSAPDAGLQMVPVLSACDAEPQMAAEAATIGDAGTPAVEVVSRPRGRPPGSGWGCGNSQLTTRKMGDPQPAAEGVPKDNPVCPHRASGKYKPGDAIVDNAPRCTSAEVLLAKQQAQEKAVEIKAAAIALKCDQQRKIAELEDNIRRQDDVILERSHRPDLFDLEVVQV